MNKPTVLLVEDEAVLAEIISESLESRGFAVRCARTFEKAVLLYHQSKPDLLVLDVMLPDGDGFVLATQIRKTDPHTPILFLTSRSRPEDVVNGFERGGNDYLKKPFSIAELVVRLQALINRQHLPTHEPPAAVEVAEFGTYRFHYPAGILERGGVRQHLTSREADLLHLLLLHRNDTIHRNVLLSKLWGSNDYFAGRSLDVFISKLRRYLKMDPAIVLVNVRGKGYKLVY